MPAQVNASVLTPVGTMPYIEMSASRVDVQVRVEKASGMKREKRYCFFVSCFFLPYVFCLSCTC
jgi:hypothetical protein